MKDDPDALLAPRKKAMRFTPKIPPRKLVKREVAKIEPTESKDEVIDKELLSKLHNTNQPQGGSGRWLYKNGKRVSSAHVTFGDEDASKARTFGNPKSGVTGRELKVQEDSDVIAAHAAAAEDDDYYEDYDDRIDEQDYSSYYRISLPLTKPDVENPESLAIQEFGETSTSLGEPRMNAAVELGLTEEKEEPELIFFQLPANLPLLKPPSAAEDDGQPAHRKKGNALKKEQKKEGCRLEEIPGGLMGKLRVYQSGKVKLKLGDSEFDVSPGAKTLFAQEAAAINTKDKHCCILGEITKRAVVTPDVDALLDSIDNLNVRRR